MILTNGFKKMKNFGYEQPGDGEHHSTNLVFQIISTKISQIRFVLQFCHDDYLQVNLKNYSKYEKKIKQKSAKSSFCQCDSIALCRKNTELFDIILE